MFLLVVMCALCSAHSATFPVSFFGRRSQSIKCVSVPPATRRKPPSISPTASACALSRIRCWYSLNSGLSASPNATALAAMMCSSGPPWMPGNTLESIAFACCCLQRMSPLRGPRSVLWVVVVTASASGTGEGCSPTATIPAMCAMSQIIIAPASSAISRSLSNSSVRGYAEAPQRTARGRTSRACFRAAS